ncbi:MAG: 6,7-dimethyl-8-ribityllumazine synthase [Lentisphaeria bacterium]|nr:6,7-dimethyl-8-ribityllumazine synthase [Lentisphaeria bacterium]NQZ70724.1 6,7-dimethyl-8-ribityllumazine synthase [Lentisphaeria bacterium]
MDIIAKTVYEGGLEAGNLKIGIVCARFNELLTKNLLHGAMDSFVRHGGKASNITVAWVPGAYEIPLLASQFAKSGKYDALIGLGLVIEGKTSHADHINSTVAHSLSALSVKHEIPIIFAVVAAENLEQAMERCGTKLGNRGSDAAASAIEMANLMKKLKK